VWLVDELPKGPTGKILRREVHRPGREAAAADGPGGAGAGAPAADRPAGDAAQESR
jgi:hypothetical protein